MDTRFRNISEQFHTVLDCPQEVCDARQQYLDRYQFLVELLLEEEGDVELEGEGGTIPLSLRDRLVVKIEWTHDAKDYSVDAFGSLLMESPYCVRSLESSQRVISLDLGPALATSVQELQDCLFPFLCGGMPLFDCHTTLFSNHRIFVDLYNLFLSLRMPTWCRTVVEFACSLSDDDVADLFDWLMRQHKDKPDATGLTYGLCRRLWRCEGCFPWGGHHRSLKGKIRRLVEEKLEDEWLHDLHSHPDFNGLREEIFQRVPRVPAAIVIVTSQEEKYREEEEEESEDDLFGGFSLFGDSGDSGDSDDDDLLLSPGVTPAKWESDIRTPQVDYVCRLCQEVGNTFAFEALPSTGGNCIVLTPEVDEKFAYLDTLILRLELFYRSMKFAGMERTDYENAGRLSLQVLDSKMLSIVVSYCYGRLPEDFPIENFFRLISFGVMMNEWEFLARLLSQERVKDLTRGQIREFGYLLESPSSQSLVAFRVGGKGPEETRDLIRESRKEENRRVREQHQRELFQMVQNLTEKVDRQAGAIDELKIMMQTILKKLS